MSPKGKRSGRGQLSIALGPYTNRRLFSEHFLDEGLPGWAEFRESPADGVLRSLTALWDSEATALKHANEAQTEERFIKPVLDVLGYSYTVQAAIRSGSRHRQPDYALFADDQARHDAEERQGGERFAAAVAVCDAKRFDRPLDKRGREGRQLSDDPVAQIVHYVAVTRTRWGILTNGRLWRLYAAEGDLVEGACLEVDLIALIEAQDAGALRYFTTLFSAAGLAPGPDGRSVADRALDGSRARAVAVGDRLQSQIFAAVPLIAEGLLADELADVDDAVLATAFDHALVVLYRLLFCLNAEDRELLPVEQEHYAPYSLRRQRRDLASARDAGRLYSRRSDDLYNDLQALFRIVDRGDPDLGVNEYDGGLFSGSRHPWLGGRTVDDKLLSTALDLVFRVDGEQVDYRDLSVRHLGTIFERLLAYRLAPAEEGHLELAAAPGRRSTGAWFTPEYVVDEIVERTLAPIMDRRSAHVRAAKLRGPAALAALLDVHVLDPAMGSGHFLVGAAAYIARRIATDPRFDGEESLADLQGLVVERCLYGVDLNPMAVEIARLALWLTTVRDDRPLRFLGNLRAGNSLVAADAAQLTATDELLGIESADRAREMIERVGRITAIDAVTADDAHAQAAIAAELRALREPLVSAANEAVDPAVAEAAGKPFHWEIEFPERFLNARGGSREGGGFDAVVGNPPYVRIQGIEPSTVKHLRNSGRFASVSGSFDVYVPFVEQGLRLLRPAGRLGYIVPSRFLKADYAKRLRLLLGRARAVEEVIDFGDAQIFDEATNYTCIVVLARDGVEKLEYRALSGSDSDVRTALASGALPAAESYGNNDLSSEPWILVPAEERDVLRTMAARSSRLDEVTDGIFTGLQTSADAIYIVRDLGPHGGMRRVRTKSGLTLDLEPDLLHPLAGGVETKAYAFGHLGNLLLFPYIRDDEAHGGIRLISQLGIR